MPQSLAVRCVVTLTKRPSGGGRRDANRPLPRLLHLAAVGADHSGLRRRQARLPQKRGQQLHNSGSLQRVEPRRSLAIPHL